MSTNPSSLLPESSTLGLQHHLTERQAASHLNLKTKTLQAWRVRGDGPKYLKLGKAVRYRLSDLLAFENERTRTSTSDPGPGQLI